MTLFLVRMSSTETTLGGGVGKTETAAPGSSPTKEEFDEEIEEEEESLMDCTMRQLIEHCLRVILKKPDASKTKDVALSFTTREAIITVATEEEWKEFEEHLAVWDFDEDKQGTRTYYF